MLPPKSSNHYHRLIDFINRLEQRDQQKSRRIFYQSSHRMLDFLELNIDPRKGTLVLDGKQATKVTLVKRVTKYCKSTHTFEACLLFQSIDGLKIEAFLESLQCTQVTLILTQLGAIPYHTYRNFYMRAKRERFWINHGYDQKITSAYCLIHRGISDVYAKKSSSFDPANLVEINCGNGDLIHLLSHQYPHARAIGFDVTPRKLKTMRIEEKQVFSEKAEIVVGDSRQILQLFQMHKIEGRTVVFACGALARGVMNGSFEALTIIQQLWRLEVAAIYLSGISDSLISPAVAQQNFNCVINEVDNSSSDLQRRLGTHVFYIYELTRKQPQVILNHCYDSRTKTVDLSFVANPLTVLNLFAEFGRENITKIVLRDAYVTVAELPMLFNFFSSCRKLKFVIIDYNSPWAYQFRDIYYQTYTHDAPYHVHLSNRNNMPITDQYEITPYLDAYKKIIMKTEPLYPLSRVAGTGVFIRECDIIKMIERAKEEFTPQNDLVLHKLFSRLWQFFYKYPHKPRVCISILDRILQPVALVMQISNQRPFSIYDLFYSYLTLILNEASIQDVLSRAMEEQCATDYKCFGCSCGLGALTWQPITREPNTAASSRMFTLPSVVETSFDEADVSIIHDQKNCCLVL